MKNRISVLLSVMFLAAVFSRSALASEKMNIGAYVEKEKAGRGEEIAVILRIENDFEGSDPLAVRVWWDTSQLEYLSFAKLAEGKILIAGGNEVINNTISWSFAGSLSAGDAFDVLKLVFKVKDDAPYGKSEINLSSDSEDPFVERLSFCIECSNHIWDPGKDKWEDRLSAGCTNDGTVIHKCSVCSGEYREVIKAYGHTISDWKITKPVSCTTDGEEERACISCGGLKETKVLKATGHKFASPVTEKKATCTEKGIESGRCASCGETTSQETEVLGHSFSEWETQKTVSCSEDGKEIRSCERCKEQEIKIIETAGHKFGEAVTVKEPTEDKEGLKERKCQSCKAKLTEIIPKLNFSESSAPQSEKEDSSSAPIKDSPISAPISETEEIPEKEEVSLPTEEVTSNTNEDDPPPKNENGKNGAIWWYIVIGSVLVLGVAGTVVFIILKKRTKVYKPSEEELPF